MQNDLSERIHPAYKALLLTGVPGSGKTTLVLEAVKSLGHRAAGFYTTEVREAGKRTGFEIVTLDAQRALLSHVRLSSPRRVGRYGVDVAALDRVGVAALRKAAHPGFCAVVDEIGRMELFSDAFREAVLEVLDRSDKVLGTIMATPHPWADQIKKDPRVKVLEIDRGTRQTVLRQVRRWLEIRDPWKTQCQGRLSGP